MLCLLFEHIEKPKRPMVSSTFKVIVFMVKERIDKGLYRSNCSCGGQFYDVTKTLYTTFCVLMPRKTCMNWRLLGSVPCEIMSYIQYLLGNFCSKYTQNCNSPEEETIS